MSGHIFQFTGSLRLKKSRNLDINYPSEDEVNWLFLEYDFYKYSFIYSIYNPEKAAYDLYFKASLKFLMPEKITPLIDSKLEYKVYRGQEEIGVIKDIIPLLVLE